MHDTASALPRSLPGDEVDALPLGRIVVASAAAFATLWVLQTLAAWADARGAGAPQGLGGLLWSNVLYYPPWIVFCVLLVRALDRRRDRLAEPRVVAALFALSLLLFFLPYLCYEVAVGLAGRGLSLRELPARLLELPPLVAFVDFILFVGCFGALYALAVARGHAIRERNRRALESQMLGLRLELERQRLESIQAQLEPHFLFNALSAISALVRTEERATALGAITRLSGLLRYALTASRVDEVTLREELAFVRDYLELQRLRYGDRLVVRTSTRDESLGELTCPPLLLQPLVENALRHDLDTHDGPSDLELNVERHGDGARITITNPFRDEPSPNTGFGLGLGTTRERLSLRYGESASLTASRDGERFVVELVLPEAVDA